MRSSVLRRTCTAAVATALAVTGLAACNSESDSAADGKTGITVNCWPQPSAKIDHQRFDEDVRTFEKQNPDIDVTAHDAFPCQDPKTFDAKLMRRPDGRRLLHVLHRHRARRLHQPGRRHHRVRQGPQGVQGHSPAPARRLHRRRQDLRHPAHQLLHGPALQQAALLQGRTRPGEAARPPGKRSGPRPRRSPPSATAPSASPSTARRTRAAGTSPPRSTPRAARSSARTARRPRSTPPRARPSCRTSRTCAGATTPWAPNSSSSSTTPSR